MTTTRTSRWRWLIAVAIAFSLVAAACGDDDGDAAGGDEAPSADGPSLIYLTPTPIGVNRFLELGKEGTEAAAARLGGTARTFESTDINSRRANLEAAVEDAPDVIIMNTFDFIELGFEFATENPDQAFILIDACPDDIPANLHCGVFREYEPSYLLGVMAGELTEVGRVGSVVALDIPFLHRYSDSFALGAQSIDPSITDSQVFIGGDNPFSDPARAKEQALALAAQGLDHIFAVGAGSNGGIFEAAVEQGFFTYGVDVNQCPDAPGQVIDNSIKEVAVVVELLIDDVLAGTAEPIRSFGLAEGGMSVVALSDAVADSGCVIADYPDIIEMVRDVADQIISGELEIPDPLFG